MNVWYMTKKISGLVILFYVGFFSFSLAQSDSIVITKDNIRQRIQLTDYLLSETQEKKDKSLIELGLLNRQIRLRHQLIAFYTKEIKQTEGEISELEELICALEEDRKRIIQHYARTAQVAYQGFSEDNFWLSLFSSESLSEAYYRSIYFQQFSRFRKKQIALIRDTEAYLNKKVKELEEKLSKSRSLQNQKILEREKLETSKVEQNELYALLRKKEKIYREELQKQREQLKLLIGNADPDTTIKASMTDLEIGKEFEKNRGFHPWPVNNRQAIVISEFGVTEDPFGNRVKNDGIELRTARGEVVKAIYGGRVTGVQQLFLTTSQVVIIQHGNYRTVYYNLDNVNVKVGDFVKADQKIGIVRTDPRTDESVLQFLIYKFPRKFVDPLTWLFPQ